MRIWPLFRGDVRFQFRYGFYFIYAVFTVLYIALLYALPGNWREKAGLAMIFTDPAAMGLYFMGAIVLFEKSERVLDSIAVSPVDPGEYALSKLLSLAVISTAVAVTIGFSAGIIKNVAWFLFGVFCCSCLFSAVGFAIASKTPTLNGFIIATIPAELLINVPAMAWLFGYRKSWLLLHPGVDMLALCENGENAVFAAAGLLVWTALSAWLARLAAAKMFKTLGGAKL